MNPEVRKILDDIDAVLMTQSDTSKQLWNVLSALRGPDDESEAKKELTIEIRRAAFPLTTKRADEGNGGFSPQGNNFGMGREDGPPRIPADIMIHRDHFRSHIRSAAKALNIIDAEEGR